MYTVQLNFLLKKDENLENLERIEDLCGLLREQGRILSAFSHLNYVQNETVVVIALCPEVDTLTTEENRYFCNRLKEEGLGFSYEIQGLSPYAPEVCHCEQPSALLLQASTYIPLHCFDCSSQIPLYRIPPTYDRSYFSYYDINQWNQVSIAWSKIEFNSMNDEIAQYQLSDISSEHNQEGLRIRHLIQTLTGKDCFYFLEELRDSETHSSQRLGKACPNCGESWKNVRLFENNLLICENCRILSNPPYS